MTASLVPDRSAAGLGAIDTIELRAWLRLTLSPGVGVRAQRRLLAAFGSPQAVLAAPVDALRSAVGVAISQALAAPPDGLDSAVEAALRWVHGGPDRRLLTLADPAYPASLLQTEDPPVLLWAEGNLKALLPPGLAMVGSRHATAQGLDHARQFAAHLSRAGFCIVSGLAQGIDGAAHEGALEVEGLTVAVVGTGLDIVYPRRHLQLAHRIIGHRGLILSEYLPGTPPLPANFPRRNRIIAGLSQGTLVVEAAPRSGSLITAQQALEANREVFAIPGSIHAPQSRGCHALIKQGAKLVECAEDILSELPPQARLTGLDDPGLAGPIDTDSDDPLLHALGHDPMGLDSLCARTGWSPAELMPRLLQLELEGRVARLPGGLFQRRNQV